MVRRLLLVALTAITLSSCGDHRDPSVATATAAAQAEADEVAKMEERKYDHCLRTHTESTSTVSFRGDVVVVSYSYQSYDRC